MTPRMTKQVLIVGSGKRVQEAALPALARLPGRYQVRGIYARTEKTIEVEGKEYEVERLEDLEPAAMAEADLIYMVVGKHAVPTVLRSLARYHTPHVDLLIETPVLLFKHLGHLHLLQRFRNTWVSEDCTELPCFDPVRSVLDGGSIGALERVVFERSAYAYHGIAMAKALFGRRRVRCASRKRIDGQEARRTVRFAGGRELVTLEPRNYPIGRMVLIGERGTISDHSQPAQGHLHLEAVVEGGLCVGFRIGDTISKLGIAERSLMGEPGGEPTEGGVTVWMEGMKRVGFLRLLEKIESGQGAYPLMEAVEDCVVDYHLEKLGHYLVNPLTSAQFASARLLMRGLTRLAGR